MNDISSISYEPEYVIMPELPEVETVRRGLAPVMEGARIMHAEIRRPDLRFPFPEKMAEQLQGAGIVALSRRAKFLLAELDTSHVLIMHLGMSGSFRVIDSSQTTQPSIFHYEKPDRHLHDHVVLHLARAGAASRIVYNDPRRFGSMDLVSSAAVNTHFQLARLGLEPTGNMLNGMAIANCFINRAITVKTALLDQRLIAGLGNIYASEALWEAGIAPTRQAGSLVDSNGMPKPECERLAVAVRDVLARAIAAGGSSLRDHRLTDGSLGYFQHSFAVYDRESEACLRPGCDGAIMRIVQSGRSTYFCAHCQD
jgi:formamidopyrimidine-DNA glycosylase